MKTKFFLLSIFLSVSLLNNSCNETKKNSGPGENEVWMQEIAFVPSEKTVSKGTTITWINKDNVQHTVTSDVGIFDSGLIDAGGTFTYIFDSIGTYDYTCTIHPDMNGTINVE